MLKPLKTVYNKRLSYLVSLDGIYREQGYKTKLDGFNSLLEVYPKDTNEEEINHETPKIIRNY